MTEKKDDLLVTSVGDHLQAVLSQESNYWATQIPDAMAAQSSGGQCHWLGALVVLASDEDPPRIKVKRGKTKTIRPRLVHAIVELEDGSRPPIFHAWAEFGKKVVVDLTNPHLQVMFRSSYRSKKNISEERTYDGEQLRKLVQENENWGPWDQIYCQPGLLGGDNPENRDDGLVAE